MTMTNAGTTPELTAKAPPGRAAWARLMDFDIGIVPVPAYLLLVVVLAAMSAFGTIKSDIATVIGIMSAFAFALGEIGKRTPILRDIGGAAVVVTFVPSFLAYHGLIPATMTSAVSDFFKSSGVLYVFIAAVIVGSILSMDRTVLIKGFAKIFVPLAVGSPDHRLDGACDGALGLFHRPPRQPLPSRVGDRDQHPQRHGRGWRHRHPDRLEPDDADAVRADRNADRRRHHRRAHPNRDVDPDLSRAAGGRLGPPASRHLASRSTKVRPKRCPASPIPGQLAGSS